MQTTGLAFRQRAAGHLRPLAWQLRASFDKQIDDSIDFFELDTSLLDGDDLLAPTDSNIIAEWDKYSYADYSDRVIDMEVTREVTEPYSIVQSYADVTLNNYDNYFTPNSGSPIEDFILPKRPFRILMGFGAETVPVFVGLSEKMPRLDKQSRTVTFHLIDFLTLIFDKEVGETTMLLNSSTSEILSELFQGVGLLPSQFDLDDSFNRVPYFFVKKGVKLGSVVQDLMKAEQGRLYLDELGVIRFKNRQNYSTTSVYSFDKANTIDYHVSDEDDIINYVKLKANILELQSEQSVWEQALPIYVPVGATVEVWGTLNHPTTAITTPVYSEVQVESSHFRATQDSTGNTPYADIDLVSDDLFGDTAKLVFENTGSLNGYVFAIDLWGTPIVQADTILVEEKDQTSIDNFEERLYELETPYIQTRNDAISKAAIMVDDFKDYGSLVDWDAKGNPALQIDDVVDLDLDGYQGDHVITKIVQGMSLGKYWQRLRGKSKAPRMYFILDSSVLDGTDVLAP